MTDMTSTLGLPYPEGPDPADAPADLRALAEATEDAVLSGIRSSGRSVVSAQQATTSTSFTLLGTPDRVQGLVLPTDGLVLVGYHAEWLNSVAGAGRAAIFLNGAQMSVRLPGWPVTTSAAQGSPATGAFATLCSHPPFGLLGVSVSGPDGPGDDVVTGQAVGSLVDHSGARFEVGVGGLTNTYAPPTGRYAGVGGLVPLFAEAGTYDVSVRYRATSGTVTARNRRLWAMTVNFGLQPA